MKRLLIFLSISAVHLIISFNAFLIALRMSIQRIETGAEPSRFEKTIDLLADVLLFPLSVLKPFIPSTLFPGISGWIPFILNSLLWGILLYFIGHKLLRYQGNKSGEKT